MSLQPNNGEPEINSHELSTGWGYVTLDCEPPTDEERITAYAAYRDFGGSAIKHYEMLAGTYIEPPTIKERVVKVGSQLLRMFGASE